MCCVQTKVHSNAPTESASCKELSSRSTFVLRYRQEEATTLRTKQPSQSQGHSKISLVQTSIHFTPFTRSLLGAICTDRSASYLMSCMHQLYVTMPRFCCCILMSPDMSSRARQPLALLFLEPFAAQRLSYHQRVFHDYVSHWAVLICHLG